jgi:hypothetical protein
VGDAIMGCEQGECGIWLAGIKKAARQAALWKRPRGVRPSLAPLDRRLVVDPGGGVRHLEIVTADCREALDIGLDLGPAREREGFAGVLQQFLRDVRRVGLSDGVLHPATMAQSRGCLLIRINLS